MNTRDLYLKYDQLLPPKFDGGLLIIALWEKLRNGEISDYFTQKEVNEILKDISVEFNQESVRQWATIKDNLFHYYLRSNPQEPWKYSLTDYAKTVVDLLLHKLDNPYRNQPLKKNVKNAFTIRQGEIRDINDLVRRFDRLFIQGAKKVITDHLDSLDEEFQDAYRELNGILHKDEASATTLVKAFTTTFIKFGERAQDITDAIISKDKFLEVLQGVVDEFYQKAEHISVEDVNGAIQDWEKAREIYGDMRGFFKTVDDKIGIIRRQIAHASEKLTELHEQFSVRAGFRLQLKKLHHELLKSSSFSKDGVELTNQFPLKSIVRENARFLFPKHHYHASIKPAIMIDIPVDLVYERDEKQKIQLEVNRQQIIHEWVTQAMQRISREHHLELNQLMNEVTSEYDLSISYQVASALIEAVTENEAIHINVEKKIISLHKQDMKLWKVQLTQ